jgi:hypothetical protein
MHEQKTVIPDDPGHQAVSPGPVSNMRPATRPRCDNRAT